MPKDCELSALFNVCAVDLSADTGIISAYLFLYGCFCWWFFINSFLVTQPQGGGSLSQPREQCSEEEGIRFVFPKSPPQGLFVKVLLVKFY